ncbi:MAG: glycosyltransferase family 9 protein [Pirellulales bacterium]|nr:glycosyltransferase family 9 protein [Pirellulales bacterium]
MKRSYNAASWSARGRVRRELKQGRYRFVRWRWHLVMGLVDALARILMRMHGALRRSVADQAPSAQEPRPIRRLLVIQLDHLGDAVISLGMFGPLRKQFPEAEIDVLAGAWTAELFAACGEVNRVYVSRVNRFSRPRSWFWPWSLVSWALRLRSEGYDAAIDVRGELPHVLLMWLAGIPRRVGFSAGGGGCWLTHSAPYVAGRPEWRSRVALLEQLGIQVDEPWQRRINLAPDLKSRRAVAARLQTDTRPRRPVFVVHLGAGTEAKRWPAPHWQELLGRLILAHDARILLIGTADEQPLADRILGAARWPNVENLLGRLSLLELIALLERAELFVGADSGPAHLAGLLGVPTIVLFSGTNHVLQWRPQGAHVAVLRTEPGCSPCHRTTCLWAEHPCMSELQPELVCRRIEHLLARRREAELGSSSITAQLRSGRGLRFL